MAPFPSDLICGSRLRLVFYRTEVFYTTKQRPPGIGGRCSVCLGIARGKGYLFYSRLLTGADTEGVFRQTRQVFLGTLNDDDAVLNGVGAIGDDVVLGVHSSLIHICNSNELSGSRLASFFFFFILSCISLSTGGSLLYIIIIPYLAPSSQIWHQM